jgi:hypothetical protein
MRRWSGGDIDLSKPLPSDLVVAAVGADPHIRGTVERYERMFALPSGLDGLQNRVRAIYAAGWRPPVAAGPSRDELGTLCTAAKPYKVAG